MTFIVSDARDDLAPEVIAIGTSRGLRIRRIGAVYFVESAYIDRSEGAEAIGWKTVAIAKDQDKPGSARKDAFEWMHRAQREVKKLK